MQEVRQGDTLYSYWIATDGDGVPLDLSDVTDVSVDVIRRDGNGKPTGTKTTLVGQTVPGTPGGWRHQYDTLPTGTYFLSVTFTSPLGIGTAPTRQNALLNVIARL